MEKPFWGYLDLLTFLGLAVGALFLIVFALGGLVRFVPSLKEVAQLIALPLQLVFYLLLFGALWAIFKIKYERPVWRSRTNPKPSLPRTAPECTRTRSPRLVPE